MRALSKSLIISCAAIATASIALAANERHRKGGIPMCESELAECTINLTETETKLDVCQEALSECEATAGQAFPATGQTTCWDASGTAIDCEGTGHDGDIQAGATLDYTDTGLTIIDNNTKLEWMKQDNNNSICDSYPGSLDKDCVFTWDEAFNFVASLNANNHAGYADWRLPNRKELESLLNLELVNPAISVPFNSCGFDCTVETCSCTAAASYWSSTSNAFTPSQAWFVGFIIGLPDTFSKSNGFHVRAVRGEL